MRTGFSRLVCVILTFCFATTISAAQTFNSLGEFNGTDGSFPFASLVQGPDGNFYGTADEGGTFNNGTVFRVTSKGNVSVLHNFDWTLGSTDGALPKASLILGTDGNFYGTTYEGGSFGYGTVFKISPGGTLTTLYGFCSFNACPGGNTPFAGLIQATDGNFYGTTTSGGNLSCGSGNGCGTVFKITSAGTLTTLYSFAGTPDGSLPFGGLAQAPNGVFYGTTNSGGAYGYGAVYKVTSSGSLTILYSFCAETGCPDGSYPDATLAEGNDGNFYGTTSGGGAYSNGTVFKVTTGGALTTLYSFCVLTGCDDGAQPLAGLILATDGNFYGTTQYGAVNASCFNGCGTVFRITPAGVLTTLYSFCSQARCADGELPYAGLVQSTNGIFYGTTFGGGTVRKCKSCGTVYSMSVGLGPFVQPIPSSGRVGARVKILGNNLTGSTAVSFNGTAATFIVASNTEIIATVPAGATTGFVTVTTPSATLTSNLAFRIR